MTKRSIPLNKSDPDRVLLTEVLPYETPIIFSAEGLYDHLTKSITGAIHGQLLGELVTSRSEEASVPFKYRVRKNSFEFRSLSVLHPRAQWKVREFYREYDSLMLYYCSRSKFSIRAPRRIAGSFFRKTSWENISRYKDGGVLTIPLEQVSKHSPSYFTYRGFDRLFKFYSSRDFSELEKQYEHFWSLDVSKCFDSIYTHSLSWAVKNKGFTKLHRNSASFAQDFDALMRKCNHDETNGIPIGPEVSRVFAEILLQEIDRRVAVRLATTGLHAGEHYSLRRYVDDVLIFARSESVAKDVYDCYSSELTEINLQTNKAKSTRTVRPFATLKSRLIFQVTQDVEDFLSKFLFKGDGPGKLKARHVYRSWSLTRSLLDSVRTRCSSNGVGYDEVSSYVIALLSERVKQLVASDLPTTGTEVLNEHRLVADALLILLDSVFFFYGVAPTVTASYKVCLVMVLASRFAAKQVPEEFPRIAQRIYELTAAHLAEERSAPARQIVGFVPLETMNILIAASELGAQYRLPADLVGPLFGVGGTSQKLGYFQIVCSLYCAGDDPTYAALRNLALASASQFLNDFSDLRQNSEKTFLFLDLIGCPNVASALKESWVVAALAALGLPAASSAEVHKFLDAALAEPWYVKWGSVDLLNALEKRELKRMYS